MNRKITKTIRVRGVPIGGGNPIPVQSMTNTHTDDVAATLAQLRRLEAAALPAGRGGAVRHAPGR